MFCLSHFMAIEEESALR